MDNNINDSCIPFISTSSRARLAHVHSLSWITGYGKEPWLTLLFTPVLFLPQQAKMTAVKRFHTTSFTLKQLRRITYWYCFSFKIKDTNAMWRQCKATRALVFNISTELYVLVYHRLHTACAPLCSRIIRLKELILIYNGGNVIGTVLAFTQYLLQDLQGCTIMQNVRNISPSTHTHRLREREEWRENETDK